MILRDSNVTITDLDILLFLKTRPRSVEDLRGFLESYTRKNVSTYTGRLKSKNLIEKRDGKFILSRQGEEILAKLREAVKP